MLGVLSLRAEKEDGTDEIRERSGHGIFATTFLMPFLTEMGDKTQLAVAGMAGTLAVAAVWIGAPLALGTTAALMTVSADDTENRQSPWHNRSSCVSLSRWLSGSPAGCAPE